MSVPLATVKASNEKLKDLKPGLVGVFVGGTSGIGEFTAKAFAKHAASPRIYLVGRNADAASRIEEEAKKLNPSSETIFIKTADASLMKNVDAACKEIQAKEKAINVLFLSQGYLTLDGRKENSEGIDKKFSLNYYSRIRFVTGLLPQLTAGASPANGGLSRVVSILGAGHEGKVREDDLDLKHNFGLSSCANHAIVLNDFAVEELAKAHPATSFVHLAPGFVVTNVMNNSGAILKGLTMAAKLVAPLLAVPADESGERNLFHATSSLYAAKEVAGSDAVTGSDGTKGSGAYLLNWDGKTTGNQKIIGALRQKGFGKTAWDHTQEIFRQAEKTWAAAKDGA